MEKIVVLVPLILFGAAGWFLYRYPVEILDVIFGKDPGQWRPIGFFRIFGIAMMCLSGLVLLSIVLKALG